MNHQYLYSYRLTNDATIHRVCAPESMEQEAVQKALETKHGRTVELLMLERTAGNLDAHFDSLSDGEAGSGTNDAIAESWDRAIKRITAAPRDKAKPSAAIAEIQDSWARAFEKVRET